MLNQNLKGGSLSAKPKQYHSVDSSVATLTYCTREHALAFRMKSYREVLVTTRDCWIEMLAETSVKMMSFKKITDMIKRGFRIL